MQKGSGGKVDQQTYSAASTAQSNGVAYRPSNWERLILEGGSQLYWTAAAGNGILQAIRGILDAHGPHHDVVCADNRNSLPSQLLGVWHKPSSRLGEATERF